MRVCMYCMYVVHIIEARDLSSKNNDGTSDPIVYVSCFGQKQNTITVPQVLYASYIHTYIQYSTHCTFVKVTSCVFDELLIFNKKNVMKEDFEEVPLLLRTHTYTYIHTYIHTNQYPNGYSTIQVHKYIPYIPYMYTYIHTYIHTYTNIYICPYCTFMYTNINKCIYSYVCTYTSTYVHAFSHSNLYFLFTGAHSHRML